MNRRFSGCFVIMSFIARSSLPRICTIRGASSGLAVALSTIIAAPRINWRTASLTFPALTAVITLWRWLLHPQLMASPPAFQSNRRHRG